MNSSKRGKNKSQRSYHNMHPDSTVVNITHEIGERKKDKELVHHSICYVIIAAVIFIFVLAFTLISMHLPPGESELPLQKITDYHSIHSNNNDIINHIISPKFSVDAKYLSQIPQINPLQTMHNKHHNDAKPNTYAVVYFVQQQQKQIADFCDLLLSLSSLSLSTNISDIIVFVPKQLAFDEFSLNKLSVAMNFKLIRHTIAMDETPMFTYIIETLSNDAKYDSIIYLNQYSFVLNDLSILFDSTSHVKLGGIWSFESLNNEYHECLLPSMLIINLNNINMNNETLLWQNLVCSNSLNNGDMNDNKIVIKSESLNKIKEWCTEYDIVSFPWWYIADDVQFTPNSIPIIVDMRKLMKSDNDPFWNEWLSVHKQSIGFCQNVQSEE